EIEGGALAAAEHHRHAQQNKAAADHDREIARAHPQCGADLKRLPGIDKQKRAEQAEYQPGIEAFLLGYHGRPSTLPSRSRPWFPPQSSPSLPEGRSSVIRL